jgi:ZIP family zinc transporter
MMPGSLGEVWVAFAWGAVSSIGLVAGALAGSFVRLSHHAIALAMSLGAGLLLASASLELVAKAIENVGPMRAVVSLLMGAALLSFANTLLARFGAVHRKRCGACTQQASEAQQPGSGAAIALGTAVDALPEALVLGLALREPAVPAELLIAISVGNLPEALSSAAGMRSAGRSYRYIFAVWTAIAIGAAVATAAGYAAFGSLARPWTPHLQAFGAGALLAMIAETMIPEAFHNAPRYSGFVAAIGFCLLLLVQAAAR